MWVVAGVKHPPAGLHFEVICAFERAAELIGRAAISVRHADVVAALEPLLDDDGYGEPSVKEAFVSAARVESRGVLETAHRLMNYSGRHRAP